LICHFERGDAPFALHKQGITATSQRIFHATREISGLSHFDRAPAVSFLTADDELKRIKNIKIAGIE